MKHPINYTSIRDLRWEKKKQDCQKETSNLNSTTRNMYMI